MGQCSRKSHGAETHSLAHKDASGSSGGDAASSSSLPLPADDVVTSICSLDDRHFATAGVDGWVHFYNWEETRLAGKFRAHKKAANQVLPTGFGSVLTASNDATVKLWRAESHDDALPVAATAPGASPATPMQTYSGHDISVVALDVLDGSFAENSGVAGGTLLVTGSRDCSLRSWDMETAKELSRRKVLRNVVTPCCLRRLPSTSSSLVQASEDLQFRLWDFRIGGNVPAHAVHAGPNQLVCMDVADDSNYVVCGSKGFSRENCEVKIFDLRTGLKELSRAACADQTIEAIKMVSTDRCLIAGKDGFLRIVDLPEVCVAGERTQGNRAYTAMGAYRRSGTLGPVILTASSDEAGIGLELIAYPDESLLASPVILATAP